MLLRFLVLAFNVAVIGFLIYRLLTLGKVPMETQKKAAIIAGGVLLLVAPIGMFIGFFPPSMSYFLIYPLVISIYLYMIRQW